MSHLINFIASNLHRALKSKSKSECSSTQKLHLVLDLDHTLLHSTRIENLTPLEEYLLITKTDDQSLKADVFMDSNRITKLRPFVRTFLKEASQMFEMHIYTMGGRAYAMRMAELLDPEKEYFFTSSSTSKITSRDDHSSPGQKKCLNLVRGCQTSNVLILDDIRNVWTKENQDNLIVMQKYNFFKSACHTMYLNNGTSSQSHAELRTDETIYLEHILRCLKRIHDIWTNTPISIDVRQVLKIHRKQVLKGCEIVFNSYSPNLWKTAEELGATCSTRADATSVTHVVATNARTKNDLLALKNKFLVCPQWIEAASYLWEKQPEHKFSIFN